MAKQYRVTVNGQAYNVCVEELGGAASPAPAAAPVAASAPAAAPAAAPVAAPAGGAASVKAPMPGTILTIKVAAGQAVKKGDVVIVLEAMKMENEITSPVDGTVKAVFVQTGKTVNTGDPMVDIG